MTTQPTTTATMIADLLHNDGQCWETDDERTFDELMAEHKATRETDGFDECRYTFSDGSIITVCGDAWDFGFPTCWCWAGCQSEECGEDHAAE